MIYSVFDWNREPNQVGHYVYFEGPGESLGIRPKPKKVYNDNRGHKLEELLPELPPGSKMLGRGKVPQGRIAILNSELRRQLGDNPVEERPWLTLLGWLGVLVGGIATANWLGKKAAS
jgi:hypothetical protein